jgi:hypothetical protein
MKTQAMFYEDGRLVLKNPLRLKTYPVKVELIIPYECTEPSSEKPMEEILIPDVDTKNTQLLEMIEEIQTVLGPLYGWADDGKTDAEKFASELETIYR